MTAKSTQFVTAWNAFVMLVEPSDFPLDTTQRHAAIVNLYMALANNGGVDHFIEATYDLSTSEVLIALHALGVNNAADQFTAMVAAIGGHRPIESQDERWAAVGNGSEDAIEKNATLSEITDRELVSALENHVSEYISDYTEIARDQTGNPLYSAWIGSGQPDEI